MLAEILKKHPDGIDIVKHMIIPVDKNGMRLSFPPIHFHHVHVVRSPSVRPRMNPIPLCLGRTGLGIGIIDSAIEEYSRQNCYNMTLMMEQHGDCLCHPEEDGIECYTQGYHTELRLNQVLDLESEMNDVRPANSEPLEWYFQIAFRWKPIDASVPPVSFNGFLGPPYLNPNSQLTKAGTEPTPTDEECMLTYSGKMLENARLVRAKLHSHSVLAQATLLFRATYADLGLDKSKFTPKQSYIPLRTKSELGFSSNEELGLYILANLQKTQEKYDHLCVGKHDLRSELCTRSRPEWFCGGVTDVALVEFDGVSYPFDRRARVWCNPTDFIKGEPLVVVGFSKHITIPVSPVHPGFIPKTYPGHTGALIHFVVPGVKHSYRTAQLFTHDGTVADFHERFSIPQFVALGICVALWYGPPPNASTVVMFEYVVMIVFTLIFGLVIAGFYLFSGPISASMKRLTTKLITAGSIARQKHEYELVPVEEKLPSDKE